MIPDVVWPICLSLDPVRDMGFKLDNLGSTDKNLAIMPFWRPGKTSWWVMTECQAQCRHCQCKRSSRLIPSGLFLTGPNKVLNQLQVLYLNCSAFNETYFSIERSLCATGLSSRECSHTHAAHGTPMVVQSQFSEEVYLAGITRSFTCSGDTYLLGMVAITPYVEDIYNIIQL